MNFKKTVVLRTARKEANVLEIDNNVLVSEVITSYRARKVEAIAQEFNETNTLNFECDTLALNKSMFQKIADYSFQQVISKKSFEDILANVYQIKNLIQNPNIYPNNSAFLNEDLHNLVVDTSQKFVNFKDLLVTNAERNQACMQDKFVEFKNRYPRRLTMPEVAEYAKIPLDHLINPSKLPPLRKDQKLVFNGYLLKNDSLQRMRDRKLLDLQKVEHPETQLFADANLDKNDEANAAVSE